MVLRSQTDRQTLKLGDICCIDAITLFIVLALSLMSNKLSGLTIFTIQIA